VESVPQSQSNRVRCEPRTARAPFVLLLPLKRQDKERPHSHAEKSNIDTNPARIHLCSLNVSGNHQQIETVALPELYRPGAGGGTGSWSGRPDRAAGRIVTRVSR